MEKEISGITTPVYQSDKEEIAECLRVFGKITSRYDVHLTLGVDGERDDSENSLNTRENQQHTSTRNYT